MFTVNGRVQQVNYRNILRFWSKVWVRDKDQCWPWLKGTNDKGYYGTFVLNRTNVISSRFVYWLHYKINPGILDVLHTCDNPPCCNPYHLFLGTDQDNMNDCVRKGRATDNNGSLSVLSKLTEEEVIEIREKYKNGIVQKHLALEYNVTQASISKILLRQTWKTC